MENGKRLDFLRIAQATLTEIRLIEETAAGVKTKIDRLNRTTWCSGISCREQTYN